MDNYLTAIGGEKAVKSVKSISYTGSTSIPQIPTPLSYTQKNEVAGKMMVEISMPGMSLMKQVVNGNSGYMTTQGQKKVLEGEELAKMKEGAVLFSETSLATKTGVTISANDAGFLDTLNQTDAKIQEVKKFLQSLP
jgi:hypothetical protein